MHSLDIIERLNEKAAQKCSECRTFHAEDTKPPRIVKEYVRQAPRTASTRIKLCNTCAAAQTATGVIKLTAIEDESEE